MIQKGNKVYVVPEDSRNVPYYRAVVSIGRKYITVDDNPDYNRFDINTHESICNRAGWNPRLKLYESKEEYEWQQVLTVEREQLRKNIHDLLLKCNNDKLKQIYNYIIKL